MERCGICQNSGGEFTLDGMWHAACWGEYNRRKAAGSCVGCGARPAGCNAWCDMCWNGTDMVFRGYPPEA